MTYPMPVGHPALAEPATQAALARYRRRWRSSVIRATCLTVAAAAAIVAGAVRGFAADEGAPEPVGMAAGTLGVVLVTVGIVLLVRATWHIQVERRIRLTLSRFPWVPFGYRIFRTDEWRNLPAIALRDERTGAETGHYLYPGIAQQAPMSRLARSAETTLLVAGDPADEAVITDGNRQQLHIIRPYHPRR